LKGQEVGIKFPSRVRKNDDVYIVKENKWFLFSLL
jgi:hypothetical protein